MGLVTPYKMNSGHNMIAEIACRLSVCPSVLRNV